MRFLKLVLAIVLGLVLGSAVNGGLVALGGQLIPPPPGVDVNTMEGLQAAMPLFEPRHFLFPFLAHALGTLAGAFVATLLAPSRSAIPAGVIGGVFLCGGAVMVGLLPAPLWFEATDLLLAYVPMAWLGMWLGARRAPAAATKAAA